MCRERCGSGKEENALADVVSNIVSEWGQVAGLVFLTKRPTKRGSKESHLIDVRPNWRSRIAGAYSKSLVRLLFTAYQSRC
jgi:hypothetical protein